MKLKYYLSKGTKVYTLKIEHNKKPTIDAHYKYIRTKSFEQSLS